MAPARYLSGRALAEALPMPRAIEAMRAVFAAAAAGQATAPARGLLRQPIEQGREALLLTMPAGWRGHGLAAKVSSFIADNPAHGHPAVQGMAVLLDAATGEPLLVVDAAALTARRTAAMVGLATAELARPDARVLGMIGTGALAAEMVRAVAAVRPLERVVAYNRTEARARALAAHSPVPVEVAAAPEQAAAAADVLVVATSATRPVLDGRAVRGGTHVNAVGNFSPDGRELDGTLVGRCRVWVDSYEAALAEAGDLLLAAREGRIAPGREGIEGDLAALATRGVGDRGPREVTLFKSVGTALADLGALVFAQQRAAERELGVALS